MKTLYLDLFSGISGDMFVGATIDLGVEESVLAAELAKLHLDGYHLHSARRMNGQIEGVKFDVHLEHSHDGHSHPHSHPHHDGLHSEAASAKGRKKAATKHAAQHESLPPHPALSPDGGEGNEARDFAAIRELISRSRLSSWVKERAIAVFHRIAVAEGKIHGQPPDRVHFHEVGAIDSIVDIVGACVALDALGRPKVFASHVIDGMGWIQCAHGRLPIPAPATLEILGARGVRVTQCEEPNELVTPTGAALLAEFVESFGPMENFAVRRIGYGLGTRENKTRPNVLRALLGESSQSRSSGSNDWESDTITVIETNLDDISGEVLGHFVDRAFAAGALDVFHTPIQMKKNRPGVLLTVLCPNNQADLFSEMILTETSAFGVRRSVVDRRKLRRESISVTTPFGKVSVKLGTLNGKVVQASPEFESCKRAAESSRVPIKQVYESALRAASSPATSSKPSN